MSMYGAIVILAEGHAAAGCANNRQFRLELRVDPAQFLQRRDHHLRRAVQPLAFAAARNAGEQAVVRYLGRRLASTLADVESGHGSDAIGSAAQ